MRGFLEQLFSSEAADTIFGFVLLFGIGISLYACNWACFFKNLIPGKKWVSMVPPLGGLLIAVGILTAGGGWWALVGLTDPWIWSLAYSLIKEKKEDTDKNGKHSN